MGQNQPYVSAVQSMKRYLSSLACTVTLLLITALLCLLGTVIPQSAVDHTAKGWPDRIMGMLSLNDLYHSPWLIGVAGLLGLNLILCLYRRRLELLSMPGRKEDTSAQHRKAITLEGDINAVAEDCMRSCPRGFRIRRFETQGGILMYGEAVSIRRWASVSMHLSILAIIAGMVWGSAGITGTITLSQGAAADQAVLADGAHWPLGFEVRCDGFRIEQYPDGMPKEYVTELAFLQDGRIRQTGMLRVNHPLAFHGLRFYQESYIPQYSGMVTVTDGRHTQSVRVCTGDVMELNGGSLRARVQQIGTNLMRMGPALLLELQDVNGARRLWLFQGIADIKRRFPGLYARVPEFNPARVPPYIFTLDSVATTYATGLGVRRDSGAPLVAVGAVLFFLGLLCVFLIPEHRLWIRLEPSDGSVKARVWETRNGRPVHPPCRWLSADDPRRKKP